MDSVEVISVDSDFFIQVYDHYLAFSRDILGETNQRKQFEIGLLIWYFKYWYTHNLRNLDSDESRFLKKNIGTLESYIKAFLLYSEAELPKNLENYKIKKPISQNNLSLLEKYRENSNWARYDKAQVIALYEKYKLMTHESISNIRGSLRGAIGKDSLVGLIDLLNRNNVIQIYHGICRDDNKKSYLYLPGKLNSYIRDNYISNSKGIAKGLEAVNEYAKKLQERGFTVIPPGANTKNPKIPKQNQAANQQPLPRTDWKNFLEWAKSTPLTKERLSAIMHLSVLAENDHEIRLQGEADLFIQNIVKKYYTEISKPKKEVSFI